MSVLTLIRHGQASFFDANYDQLSEIGHKQARALGEYWARRKLRFDEIFTGPRVRQQRSAELTMAACRQNGHDCPSPVVLQDLDEYDLKGLTSALAPELCRQNPEFAQTVEQHLASEAAERVRTFQGMFEPLLLYWQSGAAGHIQMETWQNFRGRVVRAIRNIQKQGGRSRRLALFTSGGFIGSSVQFALGAPDRAAIDLHWRLRNCSITEFAFTPERFSLDTFNAIPHLEHPSLVTYR